jgi:predicted permease
MPDLWRDIRFAVRLLAKTPAVTAIAVLSLALGIGANTAIFSIVDALMLRTLPIPDPHRLVTIGAIDPGGADSGAMSLAMFAEIRRHQRVFSGMFAWMGGGVDNVEANGVRYAGSLETVSGDYFRTLGIQPLLGRLPGPADVNVESGAASPVAVLSYACWQRRYNGDPGVLGKTLRVEGIPLTIIGVAPRGFSGLIADIYPEAIVPIGFKHSGQQLSRDNLAYQVLGRLKPGITREQAQAQMRVIWPGVLKAATTPKNNIRTRRVDVQPAARGNSWLRQRLGRPLAVLMAVVGAVLLIACVNLANLMLARAATRRHEFGIRVALGASKSRLVFQVLVESLILSIAGAVVGLAVALRAGHLLLATFWSGLVPLAVDTSADARVLAFTAGASILTGVLFGLAPAWSATRADPAEAFSANARGSGARSGRLRGGLMIAQIALSLMLVSGAAMFTRSLGNLYSKDPGYRRDHLLALTLFPQAGREKIASRTAYYRELIDRISAIPGVVAASYSNDAPGMFSEYRQPVSAPGSPQTTIDAIKEWVGPDFFQLIGMHVLRGREFGWQDDEHSPRLAIISESLARRLFPKQDPIGRRIDTGSDDKGLRIVGVVNSASLWKLQDHEPAAVYLALLQDPKMNFPRLNIRTVTAPENIATSARHVLEEMGQHYAIFTESVEARLDRMLVADRLIAALSAFFGALAVMLAAIGLYGITSMAVTERTAEIGIRMALGAQRSDVLRLVLRDTSRLVLGGLALGVPLAILAGRAVSAMLFGIAPADPLNLLLCAAILIGAALLAAWLPARRATRTDPIAALRFE